MAQNLGDTVISEHREGCMVRKLGQAIAAFDFLVVVESPNEISNENLSSLIEEDLSPLVVSLVSEPLKSVYNRLHEVRARSIRLDKLHECLSTLHEPEADLPHQSRSLVD